MWTKQKGKKINALKIDVEQIQKMGGRYLLSAVDIENAENIGLNYCASFEGEIWNVNLYYIP